MSKARENAAEIKHTGMARVLVAFFDERYDATVKNLVQAKEPDLIKQLQGRAHELTELIAFFSESK